MNKETIREETKVLPIVLIYDQWLNSGLIDLEFSCSNKGFRGEDIIVDSVLVGSKFYYDLFHKLTQLKGKFEFVIDIENLYYQNDILKRELEKNGHFTFLIYKKIPEKILQLLDENKKYKQQFKFVIIARKDWNFENTFKSFPYFLRDRLFVDFPPSLSQYDFFYSALEIENFKRKIMETCGVEGLKPYRPLLKLESHRLKMSDLCDVLEFKENQVAVDQNIEKERETFDKKEKRYYRRQEIKSFYFNLFLFHPLVVIEGIWSFLKNYLLIGLSQKVKSASKQALLPLIVVYTSFRHIVLINLWRVSPRSVGWTLFRLFYPIRKIYYFSKFQFDKRILNKKLSENNFEEQG